MKHRIEDKFWTEYAQMPPRIQRRAARCAKMLHENPPRPSLQLKRVNSPWADWTARVDENYRMAGRDKTNGEIVWFWIGPHHEYEKFLRRR